MAAGARRRLRGRHACATTACAPRAARGRPGWPSRRSLVAGGVLGGLRRRGGDRANLFTENLWPVDFIRVAGFRSQSHWMPFDARERRRARRARAASTSGCSRAVVAAAVRWRTRRGARACCRPAAARGGARRRWRWWTRRARDRRVRRDAQSRSRLRSRHLLIGMSWLPGARPRRGRLGRRRGSCAASASPLAGSWAVDLALRRRRRRARPARLQRVHARGLLRALLRGAAGARSPRSCTTASAERCPAARPAVLAALGRGRRRAARLRARGPLRRRDRDASARRAARSSRSRRGGGPGPRRRCTRRPRHAPGDRILAAPVRRRASTS